MLKFISATQISHRLLLAFSLAALIPGIIISILGLTFTREQTMRSQAVETSINTFETATTTATAIPTLITLLKEVYQNQYSPATRQPLPTNDTLSQLYALTQNVDHSIHLYQHDNQLATSPQMSTVLIILYNNDPHTQLPSRLQSTLYHILHQIWPAYTSAQQQVLTAIANKAPMTQTLPLLQQASDQQLALNLSWQQVTTLAKEVCSSVAQTGLWGNYLLQATAIALLGSIVLVLGLGYIVYLTTSRPLQQLTRLSKRIAAGDTQARATLRGKNEISLVGRSMNAMLDHITQLMQTTQTQHDTLQTQITQFASEVSGVGEGDLRVHAEIAPGALGVLAHAFNYMVEELGSLIVRVKLVSGEVESSTGTIVRSMMQLVEAGKVHINSISDASTEITRMIEASLKVSQRTLDLSTVARMMRSDAQTVRESIQQSLNGIEHTSRNVQSTASKVQALGERSRAIHHIVEVIASIAHQTNRLALDAAIQAAIAGEHGLAFGTIATDIRRLAERSKDQTTMITRIVHSITEDIDAVAVSMKETERTTEADSKQTRKIGSTLDTIFSAIDQQTAEVELINQVAEQQLRSAHKVAAIMQQVVISTQQNNKHTQDASSNMTRLAHLIEQLRTSVEAFKLRENQGYALTNNRTGKISEEDLEHPLTVSGVFRKVNAPLSTRSSTIPLNREHTPLPSLSTIAMTLPHVSSDASNRALSVQEKQIQQQSRE